MGYTVWNSMSKTRSGTND